MLNISFSLFFKDFSNCTSGILPGIGLILELTLAPDKFVLQQYPLIPDPPTPPNKPVDAHLLLTECKLSLPVAELNAAFATRVIDRWKTEAAILQYRRRTLNPYTIPAGTQFFFSDNLFPTHELPIRIIVGIVSEEAFSGSWSTNPYNFSKSCARAQFLPVCAYTLTSSSSSSCRVQVPQVQGEGWGGGRDRGGQAQAQRQRHRPLQREHPAEVPRLLQAEQLPRIQQLGNLERYQLREVHRRSGLLHLRPLLDSGRCQRLQRAPRPHRTDEVLRQLLRRGGREPDRHRVLGVEQHRENRLHKKN